MDNKKFVTVLIIMIVILLISVCSFFYFIYLQSNLTNLDTSKQEVKIDETNGVLFNAEIKDLIFNISSVSGKSKMFKLSITIKSSNPLIANIAEKYNANLTDAIIMIISSHTSEELISSDGKVLLKNEILTELNRVYNEIVLEEKDIKMRENELKSILFLEFVIK